MRDNLFGAVSKILTTKVSFVYHGLLVYKLKMGISTATVIPYLK